MKVFSLQVVRTDGLISLDPPLDKLTPFTKINSRCIKDLNISHNIIKVLEEDIGRKFSNIPHSNIFTDTFPRARDIKEKKINKWSTSN